MNPVYFHASAYAGELGVFSFFFRDPPLRLFGVGRNHEMALVPFKLFGEERTTLSLPFLFLLLLCSWMTGFLWRDIWPSGVLPLLEEGRSLPFHFPFSRYGMAVRSFV